MEAEKHKFSRFHVNVRLFEKDESISSPAASLTNVAYQKNDPKRSTTGFVEDLDVNSAASAVRKAIEKAQQSIQIAKESVGRKTKGLQSFSNKTFKDSLKVEGSSSHVSSDFIYGKKLLDAKKVIDEINEKILESSKESSIPVQSCNKFKDNILVDDYKGKVKVVSTSNVLEHTNVEEEQESVKRVDFDTLRKSKESKDEVVSHGSYQNDSEKLEEVLKRKDAEQVEGDKRGEGVFEWCEDENEFEGYDNAEIYKEEGIGEIKFNKISAGDDKVSEESDITEASGTLQIEDTESTEGADASDEEEKCEKTSMDQTASDEDEYEVTSKENDARCVKTDADESNKQQNIIDNLADLGSENDGNANEVNESLKSPYGDKEDETEEPGPSNASGKYHFRKIYEEAAAKERERVKNRLVVEKAISEARERAERQRAAVEKAIEEARQRTLVEDREKVSKASVASKSSSAQSKRTAERAAVKRAPSKARQHALEKATPQKTGSDLNRYESALRTKAKLEKQNMIMERAAKAIAKKGKCDQLAQKEQAERNHLAENLDAEIKRWSNGKEGNLRALLSTLQYILGPESGWQPVSLTHIKTTSDVKKAYRKATLCVHPDKLQQWGASVQHKYICEKVFDILKVAWKRFNSEER